jgi:nucleoid-associated protein YgaU
MGLCTLGCATDPVVTEGDAPQASTAPESTAGTENSAAVQTAVAPKSTEKTGKATRTKATVAPEPSEKVIAPPLTPEYSKTNATPNPVQTKPAETPPTPCSGLILEGARIHRVVWGDTLSRIAKKYYGTTKGYYFPLIILASRDRVLDPDIIIPGMYLFIPDLQKNLTDPRANEQLKIFFLAMAEVYERKGKPIIQYKLLQVAQSL